MKSYGSAAAAAAAQGCDWRSSAVGLWCLPVRFSALPAVSRDNFRHQFFFFFFLDFF